jgi:hypothetical protein
MANNFKKGIDMNMWVQRFPAPNAHAAGMGFASDLRNDVSRNPFIYQLASNAILNRFNVITKGWMFAINPALAGTFGAGAGTVFAPSIALTNTCAAGCTYSSITTTTSWGTAPGLNILANRGGSGDYGFKIRITSLASGKTEERWIVGNTASLNPVMNLDSALSFTPAANDPYEILSGRVFMLGSGTLAAGSWKSYEVANNILVNKTQTNLPATLSTDFSAVVYDEQYVPFDHKPGEGLIKGASTYDAGGTKGCLLATAVSATSITGQAASGDAVVAANEYRNFQLRIVEDTTNPTAVGQRMVIQGHTAGPSPVYTVYRAAGNSWAVQPSATCKFVIENPNLIILWTTASATTYTYNYGAVAYNNGTTNLAADAWSTTCFAARGTAMGAGCLSFGSFGIQPDPARNARHSQIHSFRGGAVVTLDILDIAAGVNGVWTNGATYDGSGGCTFGAGASGCYAPFDAEGRMAFINAYVASQISQMWRYDVKNRVLSPFTPTEWIQAGTGAAGERMACYCAIDGTVKFTMAHLVTHLSTQTFEILNLL